MKNVQGTKFAIIDYYKESQKLLTYSKENIKPNKNLIGRITVNAPANIYNKSVQLKSFTRELTNSHETNSSSTNIEGRRSSSFDLLLQSMLTPPVNANNILINSNQTNKNAEVENLMISILTPDCIDKNVENTNKINSLQECNVSNNLSLANNDIAMINNCEDKDFEELLQKMLTPDNNIPHSEIQRNKVSSEVSTQTSIHYDPSLELSPCIQHSTNIATVEHMSKRRKVQPKDSNSNEILLDQDFNFLNPESLIGPSTFNESVVLDNFNQNLSANCSTKHNTENSEEKNICIQNFPSVHSSNKHILDILSQDIIMVSNEIQFNNIHKIGTDKWLQHALNTFSKTMVERKQCKVVDIYIDYNLYSEIRSENSIIYYGKGNTRIYQIKKTKTELQDEDIKGNCALEFLTESEVDLEDSPLSNVAFKLRSGIDKLCQNQHLLHSTVQRKINKNKLKTAIHNLFVKLYEVFESDKIPCFKIRSRFGKGRIIFKDERLQIQTPEKCGYQKFNLKERRAQLKFCRMLYILAKAYTLLDIENKLTKREIYYQLKHVLKSMTKLTHAIEEVTLFLNVGQWHLNVVAHSGLIYGKLKLKWANGTVTDCGASATIIPFDPDDLIEVQSNAYFILVVEKESIFQKLLEEDLPNKLARPFILITGKGVPDFSTQVFLKKLCTTMNLPVFILVDPDLYGIRIMLHYRFGGSKNAHLSEYLAIPNARWLGVFPSEITKFGVPHMKLTESDKRIIKCLLKHPCMESYPDILQEVNYMIKNNNKASIEGFIKNNTFLSESYLPTKFFNEDFI